MKKSEIQYPTTFKIAEEASGKYQRNHILSKKWEYGSIIIAASIGLFPVVIQQQYHWPALFSGLALLIALCMLIFEKSLEFQKGWYRTRALAESVKAESWKFRCCCKPYSPDKDVQDASRLFLDILSKIRESLDVTRYISGHSCSGDEVTEEMVSIRQKPLKERISYYRINRVEEQVHWYSGKANNAKTYFQGFFIAAIIGLLLGIILSVFQFLGKTGQYSFVGFFSAFVFALFGWMQVRRYETLSITYAKVVEELRSISQLLSQGLESKRDFEEMVNAAEMVISKEHTIWITRGEVV